MNQDEHALGRAVEGLPDTPRVVASGNFATPTTLLSLVDRELPTYRLNMLNAQPGTRTHRPMVERSIAWLTRGNRRVPYRGVEKNNAWIHHHVAALNLRRLLALGLNHENGTWVLA